MKELSVCFFKICLFVFLFSCDKNSVIIQQPDTNPYFKPLVSTSYDINDFSDDGILVLNELPDDFQPANKLRVELNEFEKNDCSVMVDILVDHYQEMADEQCETFLFCLRCYQNNMEMWLIVAVTSHCLPALKKK